MAGRGKYDRPKPSDSVYFMHHVWKNSVYQTDDVAFRIRAVALARLECQIYHLEQEEENVMGSFTNEHGEKFDTLDEVKDSGSAYAIQLTGKEKIFTDPDSPEGRFQNLMLNMMGGLEWQHLSDEEKDLCRSQGYDPDK